MAFGYVFCSTSFKTHMDFNFFKNISELYYHLQFYFTKSQHSSINSFTVKTINIK